MRAWYALQHVSAIFDQEEIVLIAEGSKPNNVTRKSKVVDRQDSSDVAMDFRLEIRPIRHAISPDRVEADFSTEVLDRFNSRRAKISRNQDFLPRLEPHGTQPVKNGVARPEKIEARSVSCLA